MGKLTILESKMNACLKKKAKSIRVVKLTFYLYEVKS